VNVDALAFDLGDATMSRPRVGVAPVVVQGGEDSVTGVAGAVLWGPLLDRLGLVDAADRRALRPIGRSFLDEGAAAIPVEARDRLPDLNPLTPAFAARSGSELGACVGCRGGPR
jgi:hypothetical protein